MALFLAGLVLFVGGHLAMSMARSVRASLISKFGMAGYKGLYSIIALLGLILIILGWPQADRTVLYATPQWTLSITYVLVWAALVLVVASNIPAGKIAGAVKHPMVLGVKLWAIGHLLVNGDVRSLLLFGSLLAFGVLDRIALKKRGDMGRPAGSVKFDVVALVGGTVLFVAIFAWLHPYIAGVRLF